MTADMSCVVPGLDNIALNGESSGDSSEDSSDNSISTISGSENSDTSPGTTGESDGRIIAPVLVSDEITKSLSSNMDKFQSELTDIDRQAADLDSRIQETREEVKYITSLLLKYEEIQCDLKNKLQSLENQRRTCLMRKNDLLATHDVFGIQDLSSTTASTDPSSSSSGPLPLLLTPGSESILLPKLKGSADTIWREPSGRNIQDMVSELFSSSSSSSTSLTTSSEVTERNGGSPSLSLLSSNGFNSLSFLNLSGNGGSIGAGRRDSEMDRLTDGFAPFGFDQRSTRLSTPIGQMPALSFSEAVSVPADQVMTQAQLNHQFQSHRHVLSFSSKMGSFLDPQSPVSGSMSPLSGFGFSSKDLDDDVDSFLGFSATPSPVATNGCIGSKNSMVAKVSASNGRTAVTLNPPVIGYGNIVNSVSNHESNINNNNNNNSDGNNSNNNLSNGSVSRFIMRQTNGTHVAVGQNRAVTYNSVLSLETSSNGYVYKSLADRSVCRFRFGNLKDSRSYPGHGEKVKVLCLDHSLQQLFTGCDDGKVRCFNISSGSLLSEFQCEGSVIGLEKGWDNCLIIATNKGWIYMCRNNFTLIASTHRTFNWICTFKPLLTASDRELRNKRCLLILPMKHRPTIIDASDGKILKEITACPVIESKPCLQVNGGIAIIATVTDKSETARSVISVYDASQDWGCIQKIKKEGIVAALRIHGTDLYVGLKFPSFGHIECYKWSNKALSLKWIACVAYVSCIAVLPSDVVLNGGPDGTVYNTTPNMKGPFLCANSKCRCKQPFARRKDLEFHYSKVGITGTTTTTTTSSAASTATTTTPSSQFVSPNSSS